MFLNIPTNLQSQNFRLGVPKERNSYLSLERECTPVGQVKSMRSRVHRPQQPQSTVRSLISSQFVLRGYS